MVINKFRMMGTKRPGCSTVFQLEPRGPVNK